MSKNSDIVITMTPIGYVVREGDTKGGAIPELRAQPTQIVIARQFVDALLGIEPGSDLVVLYYFDRAEQDVLQVHPRGDRSRPLRGVFATRSPARPNPIAVTTVRVLDVTDNVLDVVGLDALDGSPVLDLKIHAASFAQPYT